MEKLLEALDKLNRSYTVSLTYDKSATRHVITVGVEDAGQFHFDMKDWNDGEAINKLIIISKQFTKKEDDYGNVPRG